MKKGSIIITEDLNKFYLRFQNDWLFIKQFSTEDFLHEKLMEFCGDWYKPFNIQYEYYENQMSRIFMAYVDFDYEVILKPMITEQIESFISRLEQAA